MSKAWPLVKLGEVLQITNRQTEVNPSHEYRLLGVRLDGGGPFLREQKLGSQLAANSLYEVKSGDFIYSRLFAWRGAFGVIDEQLDSCFVSNEFPTFIAKNEKIDAHFLKYLFRLPRIIKQVEADCSGSTPLTRNRYKENFFLNLEIPIPPLAEQQRIVAKIERLAGKIEEARKLRQNVLDNNSKLLVAMAHRADLTNADKKNLGWKETILGELLTLNVDPVSVMPGKLYKTFGIYSFAKGIFSKAPLSGDEIKAKTLYRVHKDQFIYARLNAFEGAIGVITESHDQHFVSNEYPTFDCEKNKILPEFLLAYFSSSHIWQQFLSKSRGIGSKSGNRRIRVKSDVILDYQLILPPMEWQHKIKKISDRQKNLKAIQSQTTTELDALLPSILDKAFKGQL